MTGGFEIKVAPPSAEHPGRAVLIAHFGHAEARISHPACPYCQVSHLLAPIHQAWTQGTTGQRTVIWSHQDGYGAPGTIPEQGFDWSGIRDSSPAAITRIARALGLIPRECITCGATIDSQLPADFCGPKCSGLLG